MFQRYKYIVSSALIRLAYYRTSSNTDPLNWAHRKEALRAFRLGFVSLAERAQIEILFDATCARIGHLATANGAQLPNGLQPTARPAADVYHANFSGIYCFYLYRVYL
jgi:arginine decarboxylase-like protein